MYVPRSIPMWSLLLMLSAAPPVWAEESSLPPATEQVFSVEQLDQMLAPLAMTRFDPDSSWQDVPDEPAAGQ